MSTGIEWTDETWNPATACDLVSEADKLRSYVARLLWELDHFLEGEYSSHWYGDSDLWDLDEVREVREIADRYDDGTWRELW